jgi:hypothetical protein
MCGRRGCDRMLVEFTTTYVISAMNILHILVLKNCPIRTLYIKDAVFSFCVFEVQEQNLFEKFYDHKARCLSVNMMKIHLLLK